MLVGRRDAARPGRVHQHRLRSRACSTSSQEAFDLVLIDTPPLLSVGDAAALSPRVDAMIVMTRLKIVRRATLQELARARCATCATVKLGYVATAAELEEGYGDGGYGYYGYGKQPGRCRRTHGKSRSSRCPATRAEARRASRGPGHTTGSRLANGRPALHAVGAPDCRLGRSRHRRGWLVRRALMLADLIGLSAAFACLQVALAVGHGEPDRVPFDAEVFFFAASLPIWLATAQAMGLYKRDEERPEHTTVDDLFGVFQLVTMFVWLIFVASRVTGLASPDLGKWVIFWALAIGLVVTARSIARVCARRSPRVRAERAHRRHRPCRAADREEAAPASGVPDRRRRLRRRLATAAPTRRRAHPGRRRRRRSGGACSFATRPTAW